MGKAGASGVSLWSWLSWSEQKVFICCLAWVPGSGDPRRRLNGVIEQRFSGAYSLGHNRCGTHLSYWPDLFHVILWAKSRVDTPWGPGAKGGRNLVKRHLEWWPHASRGHSSAKPEHFSLPRSAGWAHWRRWHVSWLWRQVIYAQTKTELGIRLLAASVC